MIYLFNKLLISRWLWSFFYFMLLEVFIYFKIVLSVRNMIVFKIVGYIKRLFDLMWLSDVVDLNLIELDI